MSAELSRCVAAVQQNRHFVASRINAPAVVRRRRVYFGPFRNNPENNGVDQIVTRPPMRYTADTLRELTICARLQWAFGGSPWLPNYEQRMRENGKR